MNPRWQPAHERYRNIDIIRGLALFGVLMINLLSDFRVPLLEHIFQPYAETGWLNRAVNVLAAGVLEFKSLTIFSFLFGVGIAIQLERGAARSFLIRRMVCLFVLGLAHLFFVWNGDILTLYAICGLLLVPAIHGPWPVLALIGTLLIALPEFASFGVALPSGPAATADIEQARQVYAKGSFLAIEAFRWHEAWSLIIPLLLSVLSRTLGLMYWGTAAWRSGFLPNAARNQWALVTAAAVGFGIGAPITVNGIWKAVNGRVLWPFLQLPHVDASILLAMAYVAALLLWLTPWRVTHLPGLAATGQMALTNYLLQSILLGFVYYGYGFGLFGRMGSAATACLGVTLYLTQVQLSRLWLQHFRFGPFEWLWRSLAYGIRQPMKH